MMKSTKRLNTGLIVLSLILSVFVTACSSAASDGSVFSPVVGIQRFILMSPTIAMSTVNRTDHTVKLYVPVGTTMSLAPVISLSDGYAIAPASGVLQDFSSGPITYTVTDPAGETIDYAVSVTTDTPSAATVNGWLGRGINLGNDLDAWDSNPATEDEGLWTGGMVADSSFFDDYRDAGFDSVRIPITWSSRLGADSPYTVNSTFMNRVDTVAGWGIDRGLSVVINAHHEDWIRKMNHATYTGSDGIKQKARFIALWTQVATHFKDWPPQLVFEILNEPQGDMSNTDVSDLLEDTLTAIRATGGSNATRAVIIGANSYSSMTALQQPEFIIPTDSYLIATFHSYDPWTFAGQANGIWGINSADSVSMNTGLQNVANWAAGKGLPLYMGEYGATKYQKNGSGTVIGNIDADSRLRWYTEMAKAAASKGISYVAWDDYGDFKLYDRAAGTFDQTIIDRILNPDF